MCRPAQGANTDEPDWLPACYGGSAERHEELMALREWHEQLAASAHEEDVAVRKTKRLQQAKKEDVAVRKLAEAVQGGNLAALEECIAKYASAASGDALFSASNARDRLRRESTDSAEVALIAAQANAETQLERLKPLNEAGATAAAFDEAEASLVALRKAINELADQSEPTSPGAERLREARALRDKLAEEVAKGIQCTKLQQEREEKRREEEKPRHSPVVLGLDVKALAAQIAARTPTGSKVVAEEAARVPSGGVDCDGGDGGGGGGGGGVEASEASPQLSEAQASAVLMLQELGALAISGEFLLDERKADACLAALKKAIAAKKKKLAQRQSVAGAAALQEARALRDTLAAELAGHAARWKTAYRDAAAEADAATAAVLAECDEVEAAAAAAAALALAREAAAAAAATEQAEMRAREAVADLKSELASKTQLAQQRGARLLAVTAELASIRSDLDSTRSELASRNLATDLTVADLTERLRDAQELAESRLRGQGQAEAAALLLEGQGQAEAEEQQRRADGLELELAESRASLAQSSAVAAEVDMALRSVDAMRPRVLTAAELLRQTDGFAPSLKVGEGGFGAVYRTLGASPVPGASHHIWHGSPCAVKRLSKPAGPQQQAAWLELAREVQLLGTCRHRCLLPLLGFCLDPQAPCLVYPLMEGGSLEDRLLLGTAFPLGDAAAEHQAQLVRVRVRVRVVRVRVCAVPLGSSKTVPSSSRSSSEPPSMSG